VFVRGAATILHADLDAFFASVEQRDDPRLRGRPVIVGSGVVMAASYEARAHGVHSAMGGAQARQLCPHAVVVQPRLAAYSEASAAVVGLVDRVTRRMRDAGRVGRTVTLRLRFDDFARATRSHTVAEATAHTGTILATARDLMAAATPLVEDRGITLVGISVGNLADDVAVQLALPFDQRSGSALDRALDDVRTRFGSEALTRAVQLGRDQGVAMPLLPD
jgi:nucleotidyltransferase/DNA polymerase involved in DNA repair